MIDGHRQRRALTAAEQALHALEAGEAQRAVEAARRAAELDQAGLFVDLPAAVQAAAGEITQGGAVSASRWAALAGAVGPGPLAAFAELRATEV